MENLEETKRVQRMIERTDFDNPVLKLPENFRERAEAMRSVRNERKLDMELFSWLSHWNKLARFCILRIVPSFKEMAVRGSLVPLGFDKSLLDQVGLFEEMVVAYENIQDMAFKARVARFLYDEMPTSFIESLLSYPAECAVFGQILLRHLQAAYGKELDEYIMRESRRCDLIEDTILRHDTGAGFVAEIGHLL